MREFVLNDIPTMATRFVSDAFNRREAQHGNDGIPYVRVGRTRVGDLDGEIESELSTL